MLIGLMAKTAILLTEYASARRRDGLSIRDAALEAAKVRLRPILMTAMTLIIGLLPLVFATGAGAVGNISLGICVIAGMTVGTIALLFFVPVFFIIFQHLEEKYMPKRKMQKSVMPLIVSLLVFTSCGTYSNYHRQGSIINDSIVRSDLAQADNSLITLHSSFSQGWHEVFTEPRLAALIEEGLAHNSNLNIAKLHVDAAKASLRHARGELFPSLELGAKGGTSRFKNSGNDPMTENRFGFRAETSWEVDIFGKLHTRPDIRQAEAALKKAFYLTNNARAAFYPSLNLSGIIGWTNDLDEVVSPAGLLMRALGSLTQPVFAKGKLRAEAKKAQAEQEEAKIAFRQAILKAGQEVNDALATRQYTQRAIKQISQQVEKLTDVLDATEKRMRYDSEVNYLQVLLARQELLEARLSLLSRHYGFLDSTIQLYKALGGDVMH